jgi:hypothetical protein
MEKEIANKKSPGRDPADRAKPEGSSSYRRYRAINAG